MCPSRPYISSSGARLLLVRSEHPAASTLGKLMYLIVRKWYCEIFMSLEIQTSTLPLHVLSALVNFTDEQRHRNH